jgi:hypothetical protein
MADYNLSGLHPREFEHLVQALAMKVIALGVRPFGDGKDGGREATFDGPMSYPADRAPWDGYLVIQAKFLQRPFQIADQSGWALDQLEKDLLKFADPAKGLKKPEYYIIATNAVFTPVNKSGTIDKADALFEQYKGIVGIKDYDLWHYDKICRLLDVCDGVSRRYSALITPGDVFSRVIAMLEGMRPDFESVMSNFLQKQLRADRYVRLGQAGYATEEKTPIAQVFVDLPATLEYSMEPVFEDDGSGESLPRGFVELILREAGQKLDPKTTSERISDASMKQGNEDIRLEQFFTPAVLLALKGPPGRFVLIGGPGQGKTTIGQYVCQLYRASILSQRPSHALSPEAQQSLYDIERESRSGGIDLPTVRRFPVRIVLSHFAAALADGSVSSLLNYLVAMIGTVTSRVISTDDMRSWLAAYPWLLVLDGLDEVPASSNRRAVMERIADFWTDAAECNADVMVLATTRPQGYEREFSSEFYQHYCLRPLSPRDAMRYAKKLVQTRHGGSEESQSRILGRLQRACDEPSTSRLMRSPLQVTIMALLVDMFGDPPSQRWQLFQKYYVVIYDRELERITEPSHVLKKYRTIIYAIHRLVGLRLQMDGERAGTTESLLTERQLATIVREYLREIGHKGSTLQKTTSDIIAVAVNRLVFLVQHRADRFGFEIRTLQEFMAGEALMEGEDSHVLRRLEVIAPVSYWRNVFLFAAGNCFEKRAHAFSNLIGMCVRLNEMEPYNEVQAGSHLALDLLEEGMSREHPNFTNSLSRVALQLLKLSPGSWMARLAGTINDDNEEVFVEEITSRLERKLFYHQASGWRLLGLILDSRSSRARALIDRHWPMDPSEQCKVFNVIQREITF